ncbi:MAG: restriction endonuclease [Deltaproteobacteria bacterium]|jgi:restriction system protein|nr:restriction endonuclease [Deltaproteobacteria bacterium]
MARRKRKYNYLSGKEIVAIIFLAIVFLIFFLIHSAAKHPGPSLFIILISIAAFLYYHRLKSEKAKKIKEALFALGASNPMQLSPLQYEHFCGILLEQNGWSVHYTKVTGDQGADIIANKNGKRIVVQCKQWTSSVGVGAVQEVHAALSFYNATKALVISTADYTIGAKELAKKTGVDLLNHKDIHLINYDRQ